jgi:putative membrane protein
MGSIGRLIIRIAINAISLWVASALIDGMSLTGDPLQLLFVAVIFGVVNAFIRPILALFTCPFYVLTLGLFTFVMNVIILYLTQWLTGGAISFDGFWSAFLAGIVISVISFLLSWFLPDKKQ